MPVFTPPTTPQASSDPFFGRYSVEAGESVVKTNGVFTRTPYPWLGDIAGLVEGTDWFQGGRTYWVPKSIGDELTAAGFDVDPLGGYGDGEYGEGGYGG